MTTSEQWKSTDKPRGVIGEIWHGGPFSSPLAVAVTAVMIAAIFFGVPWLLSLGEDEGSNALASLPPAQARLDDYSFRIDSLGLAPLVETYAVSGTTMTVAVSDGWHYQPYQMRLQAAQKLWRIWADVNVPLAPEDSTIRITDASGNEVGGSSILSGVWVQE